MTKLITITGRPGAGKTTIAAILAEKIALNQTVCLIDNNQNNINIYSAESSLENINLYSCLEDKDSCHRAIKDSATELKKNMYFFSGGHEPLTEDQLQFLKEHDIFDYIIIDSGVDVNNELFNKNIIVVNQNTFEYSAAAFKIVTGSNNIIIINRYTENSEFKRKQDFKLYFCPEIIDFANGFELALPEENEKEIKKIIEEITNQKSDDIDNTKPKFRFFGRR